MRLYVLTHLIENKKSGNYCAMPSLFQTQEEGLTEMQRQCALYYQPNVTDEIRTYGTSMMVVETLDGKRKDTFYLNETLV